jgi:predicted carbohydrate-binding protein with CBM5 and CBM33 domain
MVLAGATPASAHGALMKPGSRTYLCYIDGHTQNGNIVSKNPACAAAVAQGGTNPLYNWFSVLRSDGAGRTRGFIPDGQLCSGGNSTFSAYNLARADWPVTHLTAGAGFDWWYSNWAAHPGTFSLYITKNTWSPTRALAWDDLETQPFLSVTNPPQSGGPGSESGHYYWNGALPSAKSGRHIVYSVWSRSDSKETFYGCSDVVFDGGNGQVT